MRYGSGAESIESEAGANVEGFSTLEGYGLLARRIRNPVLAEILTRIIKDEWRHFSFYRFRKIHNYRYQIDESLLHVYSAVRSRVRGG